MFKKFFITTKQNSLSELELVSLAPDVEWITPWEFTGIRFTRLGSVEESLYSDIKDKLSKHYNIHEEIYMYQL